MAVETKLVMMPSEIDEFFRGLMTDVPDLVLRDAPSRWCVPVKKVDYPAPVTISLGEKLVGVVGWRKVDGVLTALILLSGMDAPLIIPAPKLPNLREIVLTHVRALRLGLQAEKYGIPLADKIKVVHFKAWGFDIRRVDGFDAEVRLQRAWTMDTPFVKIIVRPNKAILEVAMWVDNNYTTIGTLPVTASDEEFKEWIKDVVLEIYLRGGLKP